MTDLENYIPYVSTSSLSRLMYLNKTRISPFLHTKKNIIDVDTFFMREVYEFLKNYNDDEILQFVINQQFSGHFFHPKQLYNLFQNNIQIIKNMENRLFVKKEDHSTVVPLCDIINEVNGYSYEDFKHKTIQCIHQSIKSGSLLVLIFIGDIHKGYTLLEEVKKYNDSIQNVSLAICVKYNIVRDIHNKVKELAIDNYALYSCNEFGQDITPSLLVYDEVKKLATFPFIIKLHTKSANKLYNSLTTFLLNKSVYQLLDLKTDLSNCVGDVFYSIHDDEYNTTLKRNHGEIIKKQNFVPGTIFFIEKKKLTMTLDFLKENYFAIFLQNMYDTNSINKHNSYPHFIERLFGVI